MMRLFFALVMLALLALSGILAQQADEGGSDVWARAQSSAGTPRPAATPRTLSLLPAASPIGEPVGIGGRIVAQQGAAQATIAAYAAREATQATRIAELESAIANARVTATALVVVAANTVLDPTRQTVTIQTEPAGILANDDAALTDARGQLSTALSRYPIGCRAGFLLISGNAPDIGQGIALAERVESLLREFWPDIFDETTGAEQFAQPNVQPFGEVQIDIFFYAGCEPIG